MKKPIVICLAAVALACAAYVGTHTTVVTAESEGQTARSDFFSPNDHLLIARAIAGGAKTATILIAAKPDRVDAVRERVRALGGAVKYEADELGYIRARIPLDRIWQLDGGDIEVADFAAPDQFGPSYHNVRAAMRIQRSASTEQRSAPASPMPEFTLPPHTGQSNPYSGTKDVGQPAFLAQHPTYDGRGVRVGIEEGPDLFSPFLRHSRDLSGSLVPKVADYFTVLKPHDPSLQGQTNNRLFGWVDMRKIVATRNRHFLYNDHWFTAPTDGTFRVGSFRIDYPILSDWYRNVLHPHGTACEKAGSFTVLWDDRSDTVWVNSDQGCSLADDKPMRTYVLRHDVGSLPIGLNWSIYGEHYPSGMKPPAHMPFLVQTDQVDHFVWIALGEDSHADGVATSIAGDRLFGTYDGMAPNAQLVVAMGDFAAYYQGLEGMIALARYPVDIITLQEGSAFANNEGHNVWDIVLNRLVEHYKVVLTISASNDGPTITNVETPADADEVFGIGGYVTRERLRANFGAVVPSSDYVTDYSSRGPRADGGFKPDFLAPTETLVGASTTEPPGKIARARLLPVGYQVFGGTSQAAPMAAGSLALLISAAKQAKIPHDPARLRQAVLSSARYLSAYQALDQGAGVIDVPAAWEALTKLANVTPVYETSGNAGLFEREGWHTGDNGERSLSFAFASSGEIPQMLPIRWVGNDGTFSTASELHPSADGLATLDVTVRPRTSGIHSANLQVIDPRTGIMISERMCAVVASEPLNAADHFAVTHQFGVEHPGYQRFFIDVPRDAGSFVVRLTASPQGYTTVSNPVSALYLVQVRTPSNDSAAEDSLYPWTHEGRVWQHAYPDPEPGVWEVTINVNNPSSSYSDPRQKNPLPPSLFFLRGAAFGVHGLEPTAASQSTMLIQVSNAMNGFHARKGVSSLGSRFESKVTLTPEHPRRIFTIDVAHGTTEVRAQVSSPSPRDARVQVFLFACATDVSAKKEMGVSYAAFYQGDCEFRSSGDIQRDGIASTAFPTNIIIVRGALPVGRWVAVVDALSPTQQVTLKYSDLVINPKYGSSTLAPALSFYGPGARWTQRINISRGAAVPSGRSLVALPSLPADETDTMWGVYNFLNQDWDSLAKQRPRLRHQYESLLTQDFAVPSASR